MCKKILKGVIKKGTIPRATQKHGDDNIEIVIYMVSRKKRKPWQASPRTEPTPRH